MIARWNKRSVALPIGENDERQLLAFESFFQENAFSSWPQLVLFHDAFDKIFRGGEIRGKKNSFAGAQSVRFDHHGPGHRAQRGIGIRGNVVRPVHLCRGNTVTRQKLFRENFASFELRGLLRRPHDGPIPLPECISQSIH